MITASSLEDCSVIPSWRKNSTGIDYMLFRTSYLSSRLSLPIEELVVVGVHGNSSPLLTRGGVCIVHRKANFLDGGLWAFAADMKDEANHKAMFNTVVSTPTSAGKPAAAIYPPIEHIGDIPPIVTLSASQFSKQSIGKVVWGESFFE